MSDDAPQTAGDGGLEIHLAVTDGRAQVLDGPMTPVEGGPQPDRSPVHIHIYFDADPPVGGGPEPDVIVKGHHNPADEGHGLQPDQNT